MIKMSTSSNSSFTGVSNEIYGRINSGNVSSATISAGTVKTGSLSCERLDFPGTPIGNIIQLKSGAVDATPTNTQLSFIADKGILFINADSTAAAATIILGADTSARAGELLSLFNINDSVTSRLIKIIILAKSAAGGTIAIKNSSAGNTKTNVQFKTFDVATNLPVVNASASNTAFIADAIGVTDGYILVTKGSPTTTGENAILFTVMSKSLPV